METSGFCFARWFIKFIRIYGTRSEKKFLTLRKRKWKMCAGSSKNFIARTTRSWLLPEMFRSKKQNVFLKNGLARSRKDLIINAISLQNLNKKKHALSRWSAMYP